ncbi:MAG TPA: high-potential iron-sulfur protein [Polyangiaceae bacterium]|jgi:hypothetical protein|nr:high-potential iron-sulfur protein [Polyangiaceae bacterium]
MKNQLSRRHLFVLGASTLAVLGATACKKGPPSSCGDVSGLSAADAELRKTLEYVDQSPIAAQTCEKCQQWIEPASADQCGGCKVMKGPVHPNGHCKVFVAKT